MSNWQPYKTNILIKPEDKKKVIGNTAKYYLYGEVLAVGNEVKDIKVGDRIGYTLWGLKDIEESDGTKYYFVKDDSAFILGVLKK